MAFFLEFYCQYPKTMYLLLLLQLSLLLMMKLLGRKKAIYLALLCIMLVVCFSSDCVCMCLCVFFPLFFFHFCCFTDCWFWLVVVAEKNETLSRSCKEWEKRNKTEKFVHKKRGKRVKNIGLWLCSSIFLNNIEKNEEHLLFFSLEDPSSFCW